MAHNEKGRATRKLPGPCDGEKKLAYSVHDLVKGSLEVPEVNLDSFFGRFKSCNIAAKDIRNPQ